MTGYKVSVRQICLVILAFFSSVKMIFLTAIAAKYSRQMLWVSAAINFAADAILIFVFLKIGERFPNKTFYEILSENIGKPTAKIIFFVYAICFLTKSFIPLHEQKTFVEISLYETSPTFLTFLPFFVFSFYFSYKGLKAVARCADIVFWLIIPAFFGLILLALPHTDYSELLPIFKGVSANEILAGSLKSGIWHFDSIYFLFFIGNFKPEKLSKTKMLLSFTAVAICIIFYMITIYAEFGVLTERQYFVPVKMGLFSVALLNIGRVDYFAAILLTIVNVFAISLPLVFSSYCLDKTFEFKNKFISPLIVNLTILSVVVFTTDYFQNIFLIFQEYYAFFIGFMSVVIPAVTFIFKTKKRGDR